MPERELLTPGEVAVLLRVHPKTVSAWAREGKLACIKTPGGHRRFPIAEIRALVRGSKWSCNPDRRGGQCLDPATLGMVAAGGLWAAPGSERYREYLRANLGRLRSAAGGGND